MERTFQQYYALVDVTDDDDDVYGITFPDVPGCTAMGAHLNTLLNTAKRHLEDALLDNPTPARSHIDIVSDPEVIAQMVENNAKLISIGVHCYVPER